VNDFGPSPSRIEAATAIRELAHALSAAEDDEPRFQRIRTHLDAALGELRGSPRRRRAIPDFAALEALRDAGVNLTDHAMADRAVAGPANPTAVDITTERVADEAVATVHFGSAFEGAPGRVHGGHVAAVFDDLTGYALAVVQQPGFTGRLVVDFKRPVPVETPIEFRAWIRERDGRKLYVEAHARVADETLATAEALFILVDREHFATQAADLRR